MNAGSGAQGYRPSPQQASAWRILQGQARAGACFRLSGPLDETRLHQAWAALVAHHEILRTELRRVPGLELPLQFIAPPGGPGAVRFELRALGEDQHELQLDGSNTLLDGASLHRLLDGLAAAYEGRLPDQDGLQYADVAQWALEMLEGPEAEAGRLFWRPLLPEAADSPAESDVAHLAAPARLVLRLPAVPDEVECLARWALFARARLPEVGLQLSLHAGGRQHADLHEVIGPLARWLPLNLADALQGAGAAATWGALRAALEHVLAQARRHQDCCPHTQLPRSDTAFAYDPAHPGVQAGALRFTLQRSWRDEPRFGLQLSVRAGSLASELELVCDPARWPPAEAERLLAQYAALLARPRPAGDAALRDWLAGTPPLPASGPPACGPGLLQRLQLFAALQPDAPALHCAGQTLSYGELMRRAGALSACLTDMLGACTEARVGIHLDRSAQALVALLGVLGAGATAVPLDPALPSARLAAQAARCRLRLVLSLRAHEPLPTAAVPVLWLDELTAPEPRPFVTPHPQQLAYILQTSGSTGTPKGVAVPHGALSHYADALLARLAPAPGAMWEMVTPLVVDLGWSSLLGAWCSGGTLCLRSADEASDPRRVGGADYLKITPTHLQALLAGAQQPAQVLPRRGLLLGGEAPPAALLETLAALAPQLPVYNHYGPTETTIGVVMGRLAVPPEPGQRPALGLPLDRVACSLLETGLHPVLDGALGSLWLGGPGLARGYLDDPAATAERFRPDPFAGTPGARCYDSGDLARRRADGQLEFHGRRDRQLKLRGHRIEPAEIETVLRRHPAVGQAAVVLLHEPQPALAAFVTLRPGAGPVERLLRLDAAALPAGASLFELPNGLRIAHQNATMTRFVYDEIFGRQSYFRHGIRLAPGATVVDVGANIGLFSLCVASLQPGAKLIAVEPIPATCQLLRFNTALWAPGTVVEPCGLAERPGSATFTHYPDFSGASGLFADPGRDAASMAALARLQARHGAGLEQDADYIAQALGRRWRAESVLCRLKTLSQLIEQHRIERIDLLKIDAEMSELNILRGISDADWPRIEQVVLEAHAETLRAQVQALLTEHGFEVVCDQTGAYEDSAVFNVYAHRPRVAAAPHATTMPAQQLLGEAGLRAELASLLARELPETLRPSALLLLPELARTASGKLDTQALVDAAAARPAASASAAPATPLQQAIASHWQALLHCARVGADDSFFALGGHSLLAIQSLSWLRTMLQLELPLRLIFEAPTARTLAAALQPYESAPGRLEAAALAWLDIDAMTSAEVDAALGQV